MREREKSWISFRMVARLDTNIFFVIRVVYALKTCFRRISDASVSLKVHPPSTRLERCEMSFIIRSLFMLTLFVVMMMENGCLAYLLSLWRRVRPECTQLIFINSSSCTFLLRARRRCEARSIKAAMMMAPRAEWNPKRTYLSLLSKFIRRSWRGAAAEEKGFKSQRIIFDVNYKKFPPPRLISAS